MKKGVVGTFLAALSAFASVALIVLRDNPHIAWTWLIIAGWVVGVAMQIIAGAIAAMIDDVVMKRKPDPN